METSDAWARQVKAARQLLQWEQTDLARESGLSIATVKNFERATQQSLGSTAVLRQTFERAGIEFILPEDQTIEELGVIFRPSAAKPKPSKKPPGKKNPDDKVE